MKEKAFNMAKGGYCDAAVFDCQVRVHKTFFGNEVPSDFKPLQKDDWPPSIPKTLTGPVYDITGFYGEQVVALLSLIVNDKDQFTKGKTFYLLIRNSPEDNKEVELEPLYKLKARPTKQQPGNGIVVLRPKGKVKFTEPAKKYDALNGALEAHYETNTTSFAKNIKKLLKGNKQNKDIPEATFEAYMILLFEIARRLVKSEKPVSDKESSKKEEYDVLPIGSAIARFIKLLEKDKCSFHNVFLPKEAFHCFTGEPKERRKAIEAINAKIKEILAEKGTATKEQSLKELQELFCSDQRLEEITSEKDQLAKTSKDLENLHLSEALSDAESYTAFDHCE